MPLFPRAYSKPCPPDNCPEVEIALPILVNNTNYIGMTMHSTLYRIVLDPRIDSLESLLTHGGIEYLASRPRDIIGSEITDSAWVHQNIIEKLRRKGSDSWSTLYGLPSPLKYRAIPSPFNGNQLALEIVMPDVVRIDTSCPTCSLTLYRILGVGNSPEEIGKSLQLQTAYRLNYIGAFDIEHILKSADVNRVPLETTFRRSPPCVTMSKVILSPHPKSCIPQMTRPATFNHRP